MSDYINSNLVEKLRKAINILNELKTVDGAGSGLDADLLDGQHGAYYLGGGVSRVVTDTTTELTTDGSIICNKATAMTVNLLAATGSNRIRDIANINDGAVTVTPDGADIINGESSQIVYKNSCMVIKDYAANKWIII